MRSSAFLIFASASLGDGARVKDTDGWGRWLGAENWGRLCPPGLDTNATAETCMYAGELFDDPDKHSTDPWAGGSQHPLVFTPWGGLEDPEGELIKELQFMVTRPEFVHDMVHSMRHLPRAQHHGLIADIEGVVESLEADKHNLAGVEFIAEHAVEHLVLEGLVFGLATLEHAAAHAGIGAAALALEGTVVGIEIVASILSSPVILGASAVHTAYQLRNHFLSKDARSREFAVALVAKADCIVSKIELHHEQIFLTNMDGYCSAGDTVTCPGDTNAVCMGNQCCPDGSTCPSAHHSFAGCQSPKTLDCVGQFQLDPTFFRPEFQEVCGTHIEVKLAEQMVKTNMAMVKLFKEFKGIGKCLFPEGSRRWSKSNCVNAIYEPLREMNGEPGLLYSAFALAAAYAQETDEILNTAIYAHWFEEYFNITMPHSQNVREDLIRVRDGGDSMQESATTCISIVGLHRAFERVFIRLKTALDVYMHTFAREKVHWSTRTTQHPCRRVFRKLEDRELGLCKEGLDLPLVSPDSEWLMEHAEHLSATSLDDVGSCIEDTHPEIALSIFSSGPEEGENEEEERQEAEEEAEEEADDEE